METGSCEQPWSKSRLQTDQSLCNHWRKIALIAVLIQTPWAFAENSTPPSRASVSLEASETLFRSGKNAEALVIINEALANPFLTPRDRSYALCRKGLILSIQRRFDDARSALAEAIQLGGLPSEVSSSCSYALIQIYVLEKKASSAIALIDALGEPRLSSVYQARLWALGAEAAREARDTPKEVIYLQRLLNLMESQGFTSVDLKILGNRSVTLEDVKKRLGLETPGNTLQRLPERNTPPPITDSDRYGKLMLFMHETLKLTQKGDWTQAEANWKLIEKRNLTPILERLAGIKAPIPKIIERLEKLRAQDPRVLKVGILLPSDPELVGLTFRLLRAASAFLASPAASGAQIEFYVRHSPTDPGAIENASLELILEDHVHAIVGPISSSLTVGALSPAQTFGVPVFALGPVSYQVSQLSPLLVRMGVLARSQTDLIARHTKEHGFENLGIFAPNDAYGYEMAKRMMDALEQHSLKIDRATFFDASSDVFRSAVQEALGPQDSEARKEEYDAAVAEAKAKARMEKRKFDPAEIKLPPLIRFDALFIPDSLRKSRVIASTFAFFDAKNLRLFGDKQWNDPNAKRTLADEFLNGSRVPTPVPGRYYSHLVFNLGADNSSKAANLGTLELERQVFDALLLLRQAHFLGGSPAGAAMISALRNRTWKLEGTTIIKGLSSDGEPLTEFNLKAFGNGRLNVNLPSWNSPDWKDNLKKWATDPESFIDASSIPRSRPQNAPLKQKNPMGQNVAPNNLP